MDALRDLFRDLRAAYVRAHGEEGGHDVLFDLVLDRVELVILDARVAVVRVIFVLGFISSISVVLFLFRIVGGVAVVALVRCRLESSSSLLS